MSRYEQWQHLLLEQNPTPTPYENSVIAHNLAEQMYCNWHEILDYSSLSQDSITYKTFFSGSAALTTMARYLAHTTRKGLFLWQSETLFQEIQHILCPAVKCYTVHLVDFEQTHLPLGPSKNPPFPSLSIEDPLNKLGSGKPFLKRTKGVKRQIIKFQTSLEDFIFAAKSNGPPRYVQQHSIKKHQFRLYLISQNKLLLSRIVIKRLAYAEMSNLWSFFTYPLCFKRLLDKK